MCHDGVHNRFCFFQRFRSREEGTLRSLRSDCLYEAIEDAALFSFLFVVREGRQLVCEVSIAPGQRVTKPPPQHGVTICCVDEERLVPRPFGERV